MRIAARQASPILIRPQANLDLQLSQSSLRIAQAVSYQYQMVLQSGLGYSEPLLVLFAPNKAAK